MKVLNDHLGALAWTRNGKDLPYICGKSWLFLSALWIWGFEVKFHAPIQILTSYVTFSVIDVSVYPLWSIQVNGFYFLLPPFHKSRNASSQSTVTWSLGSFLRMTTRHPMSTKGLRRADEAGPSLARDVEEASAGNGRAQSSVPTFMGRRKY